MLVAHSRTSYELCGKVPFVLYILRRAELKRIESLELEDDQLAAMQIPGCYFHSIANLLVAIACSHRYLATPDLQLTPIHQYFRLTDGEGEF